MQFVNVGIIQQSLRAEFYITNYNTDEFLSPTVRETFANIVVALFQHPKAHIIQIIQPSFRGISVPLSPAKRGLVFSLGSCILNMICLCIVTIVKEVVGCISLHMCTMIAKTENDLPS